MTSRPKSNKRKVTGGDQGSRTPRPSAVGPSARYTAPTGREFRVRPEWHKVVGIASIVLGAALFFVCALNIFGIHDFGGHIWYLVGFAIAGSGAWWLGLFDPPPPRPHAR